VSFLVHFLVFYPDNNTYQEKKRVFILSVFSVN